MNANLLTHIIFFSKNNDDNKNHTKMESETMLLSVL